MTDKHVTASTGRPAGMSKLHWLTLLTGVTAWLAIPGAAAAETSPTRGGILEFAVDAEPPNYDCHANFSFVFIHPVIPHYSTLLKFDTANYPQIVGDLAQSWTVSPDKPPPGMKPGSLSHRSCSSSLMASASGSIHEAAW